MIERFGKGFNPMTGSIGIPINDQLRAGSKVGDTIDRAMRLSGLKQFVYLLGQITDRNT